MRPLLILYLLSASAASAASLSSTYFPATQVNALDNAGGGARAMALGSAFVAVADDSSAQLWNPAGLMRVPRTQVGFHHNAWLAGITQDDLNLVVRSQSYGAWGLSQDYVDEGSYDARDSNGAVTGGFSANRIGLGLAWASSVGPTLDLGLSVRDSRQTLANYNYDAVSGALGLLYRPAAHVQIGLDYNALGNSSSGDPLASGLRLGGSVDLPAGDWRSLLAASADLEPSGVNRLHLGSELKFHAAAVRAGYLMNLQDNRWGGLNSLTLGGGLGLGAITVDYAYLPFGQLGVSHRVSLEYAFIPPTPPAPILKLAPEPTATPQAPAAAPSATAPLSVTAAATTTGTEPVFTVMSDGCRLGQALEAKGDTTGASQAYHAALALDPKDGPSWRGLARLYDKAGRQDFAKSCYQGVLRVVPEDEEALQWMKEHPGLP